MDVYSIRITAAHARHARRRGNGNVSEGVRTVLEKDAQGFSERRKGPSDRRKK
jgi:hypothetical protein